ncbi:hypothetical protein AALA61_16355, partial [Oscillospiraceae bacterium 42-9]
LAAAFSPEWVLEGDIKGCFDHISHQFVLNPCRRYLDEYNRSFTRARQGALGGHDDCYYQKLDYTVPLAFRGFFSFLQKRR